MESGRRVIAGHWDLSLILCLCVCVSDVGPALPQQMCNAHTQRLNNCKICVPLFVAGECSSDVMQASSPTPFFPSLLGSASLVTDMCST